MRLGLPAVFAAFAAAACGAQISDGSASFANLDAGASGSGSGTATDAPGLSCTSRVVFLNFDGDTLTKAATSDATLDQASWLTLTQGMTQGTAPRYQDGNADRDSLIQDIVDRTRAALANIPVTIVTQRPAGGQYVMVVLGGTAADIGSRFTDAVNQLDCGDQVPNDVAWIADSVSPVAAVVNTIIGAVGFGIGLTATSDPEDCMCGWANNCTADNSTICTLGSPIDRDSTAHQLCPNTTTQDEIAAMRTAFCH